MHGCNEGDFVATYDARHAEWVVGRVLTVRGGEAHVAWHARAGHVEEWCVPFAVLRPVSFEAGAPPEPPKREVPPPPPADAAPPAAVAEDGPDAGAEDVPEGEAGHEHQRRKHRRKF